MRLDRAVSLYAFRPLLGMNLLSGKSALPILMYHSISDDAEPGVSPYYKTATSPSVFSQQMSWLRESGFRTVNLLEGIKLAQEGRSEEEKVVVITFDDGFRDFHDYAFPVLKAYDYTATVFLPTAFIGENRRSFKNKEGLTWQEVRALRKQGIEFGSHTMHHPVLYHSSWAEIEDELSSSKRKMEQELGQEVPSFAYPYAFPQQDRHFTVAFKELLKGLGYQTCVTTMIGRVRSGDDVLSLKRLPVNNCDDQLLFQTKLAGGYDGMGRFQSWSKSIRHGLGKVLQSGVRSRSAEGSIKAFQSSRESIS